jgi:hypothetical protein
MKKIIGLLLIILVVPYVNAYIEASSEYYEASIVGGNMTGYLSTILTIGTQETIMFSTHPNDNIQEYSPAPQSSLVIEGSPYGSTVLTGKVAKVGIIYKSHDDNFYVFPFYHLAPDGYNGSFAPYKIKVWQYPENRTLAENVFLIGGGKYPENAQIENLKISTFEHSVCQGLEFDYLGCSLYKLEYPAYDYSLTYAIDSAGNYVPMLMKYTDLLTIFTLEKEIEKPTKINAYFDTIRQDGGQNPSQSTAEVYQKARYDTRYFGADYFKDKPLPEKLDEFNIKQIFLANQMWHGGWGVEITDSQALLLWITESKEGTVNIKYAVVHEYRGDPPLETTVRLYVPSVQPSKWTPSWVDKITIEKDDGLIIENPNIEVTLPQGINVTNNYITVKIKIKGFGYDYKEYGNIVIHFVGITDTYSKFYNQSGLVVTYNEYLAKLQEEGKNTISDYAMAWHNFTKSDKTVELLTSVGLNRFTGTGNQLQEIATTKLYKVQDVDWLPENLINLLRTQYSSDVYRGKIVYISTNYYTTYTLMYVFNGIYLLPRIRIKAPLSLYNIITYIPTAGKPSIETDAMTIQAVSGKGFNITVKFRNVGTTGDTFYGRIVTLPPELEVFTIPAGIYVDKGQEGSLTFGLIAKAGLDYKDVNVKIRVYNSTNTEYDEVTATVSIEPPVATVPPQLREAVLTVGIFKANQPLTNYEFTVNDESYFTDSSGYCDITISPDVNGTVYKVEAVNPLTNKKERKIITIYPEQCKMVIFNFTAEEVKEGLFDKIKPYLPYIIAGMILLSFLYIIRKPKEGR